MDRLIRKTYHVDLSELMRLYETNYAKLNALLPLQPQVGDIRCYQAVKQSYQLEVLEITKYTTLVEICQSDDISTFPLPTMSVRLYHDARVSEVYSSERLGHIKARYEYPNVAMMQKDEKAQINRFLGDWLTFCLKRGISRAPLSFSKKDEKL